MKKTLKNFLGILIISSLYMLGNTTGLLKKNTSTKDRIIDKTEHDTFVKHPKILVIDNFSNDDIDIV